MIKGRKRMFDDRFGETIGSFLDYSQSASLTYKGDYTLFNSFISPDEYRKGLNQMYEWAKDEIEIEVHQTEDKYQKSLFIGHVLTETSAALALLDKDRNGNFTHKNFPGIESKGKTVSETDFQDFYYWSDHFLRKMVTFLDIIMVSIGRMNQGDNATGKSVENKSNNYSFKIKAGYSKKIKATTLFTELVTLNCLEEDSKNDFINAFTGTQPAKKINWIGKKTDLMALIKCADKEDVIHKVKNKWVVTANIFTIKGLDIKRMSIKDMKITASQKDILKLVNSMKDQSLRP